LRALHAAFEENENDLKRKRCTSLANSMKKNWKRLERRLRSRARFIPVGSLPLNALRFERLEGG